VLAPVLKLETRADDKVTHRGGREHLARTGEGADPGTDMDSDPCDVVVDDLDLAGVDPGP
jgi:hypothetical protein